MVAQFLSFSLSRSSSSGSSSPAPSTTEEMIELQPMGNEGTAALLSAFRQRKKFQSRLDLESEYYEEAQQELQLISEKLRSSLVREQMEFYGLYEQRSMLGSIGMQWEEQEIIQAFFYLANDVALTKNHPVYDLYLAGITSPADCAGLFNIIKKFKTVNKSVVFLSVFHVENHWIPVFIVKFPDSNITVLSIDPELSTEKSKASNIQKLRKAFHKLDPKITYEDAGISLQLYGRDCGILSMELIETAFKNDDQLLIQLDTGNHKVSINKEKLPVSFVSVDYPAVLTFDFDDAEVMPRPIHQLGVSFYEKSATRKAVLIRDKWEYRLQQSESECLISLEDNGTLMAIPLDEHYSYAQRANQQQGNDVDYQDISLITSFFIQNFEDSSPSRESIKNEIIKKSFSLLDIDLTQFINRMRFNTSKDIQAAFARFRGKVLNGSSCDQSQENTVLSRAIIQINRDIITPLALSTLVEVFEKKLAEMYGEWLSKTTTYNDAPTLQTCLSKMPPLLFRQSPT